MIFNSITPKEIIYIHKLVEKRFNLPSGHIKNGELETLVSKCYKIPFAKERTDVLEQAAILFEGIIRLHIFIDGNKRTALETTRVFLNRNDCILVVPLSGANFIYKIAQNCTSDTEQILSKITNWLKSHTAKRNQHYKIKGLLMVHFYLPLFTIRFFTKIKLRRCGRWIIKKYLTNKDPQITEFMLEIYEKQLDLF